MIEYNVYEKTNSVITGEELSWLEGKFMTEENAKLFMKAIKKIHPKREYFISEWDTENKKFIK